MTAAIVRLLRPHQYTKNLLLFAAPGAAGLLDEGRTVGRTLLAFVLFCAVSSAGYIANDLADVDVDRLHPRKQRRPIASGEITSGVARRLLAALLVIALAVSPALGANFVFTLVGYAGLTFAYTLAIKQLPWVELVIVSAGFVLRAVAGGAATDVTLSSWFLLVVSAGALFVIAGKRLGELLTLGPTTPSRPVLRYYSPTSLRALSAIAAIIATSAYAAWALTDAGERGGDDVFLRLTIVPFVLALLRYLLLAWRGRGEAPDLVVLRDPWVLAAGAAWVLLYVLGLYT